MKPLARHVLPVLVVLGLAAAGCGEAGAWRATTSATASPVPTSASTSATVSPPEPTASPAGSTGASRPSDGLVAGRYQPLWPFSDPDEVAAWRRAYLKDGRGSWHLDARRTALAFARDYLGFTEIDRVAKTVEQGAHARVHVGYRGEEGPRPLVAAVVHLVRYGSGGDAPWEVVGTDDTTLSLTRPGYGAAVRSPLTVGGRISGVDESIRVQVRQPGSPAPVGETCCVSAGGSDSPWSARVSFAAEPGRTLTIVASTGGHLAAVERFAVTGVSLAMS
ncbi:hypothetical protein [Nonomuraea sp. NPDC049784]|uniref:hypothetical protein n=1 Tax=Nonomuraea sp. NPDC049784 TaxID=3154361 RepID=UPI0033E5CC5D